MRIIVFFDLPVKKPNERKAATKFRTFLLKDGYHMIQYSVYARVCCGMDDVEKHKKRLYTNVPNNGSIRALIITEKQYESIIILVGKLSKKEQSMSAEQLSFF